MTSALQFRADQRPAALVTPRACGCGACWAWLALGQPDRELAPIGRWSATVLAVGRSKTRREIGGGLHTRYQGADPARPWVFELAPGVEVRSLWNDHARNWPLAEGDACVVRVVHRHGVGGLHADAVEARA